MKIAVISTGRSRCTLLAKYLHTLHADLEFSKEFYTEDSFYEGHLHYEGRRTLVELTDELFAKENFVVKIMAMNLYKEYDPSVFKLEEYDQIHLIERSDFFQQCCSWMVARTNTVYNLYTDNPRFDRKVFDSVRQHQCKLKLDNIKEYASYVDSYLKIKRYLVDNNVEYTLHTYESAKQFDKKQNMIEDSNLNYSEMITNYHLKENVNAIFNKHFSYDEMTSNLELFNSEIGDVGGLGDIHSFANKLTKLWNQ
jgi:hypothetical protein